MLQPNATLYIKNIDWKIKKPYKGFEGSWWKQAVAAHDTLLINLKEDPGERNNLYEEKKTLATDLFQEMSARYDDLGKLPPSMEVSAEADHSFLDYLKNKRRNDGL